MKARNRSSNKKTIGARRTLRRVIQIAALAVSFFFLSLNVEYRRPHGVGSSAPHKIDASQNIDLSLVLSSLRELSAAESLWGFVRQSATWANSNSILIDGIITSVKKSGVLALGTYQKSDVDFGTGVIFKMEIGTVNKTVNLAAKSGTTTYSHYFYLWRQSDGAKALEVFFDDPDSPKTGDGAAAIYKLGLLNPREFDNPNAIVETRVFSKCLGSQSATEGCQTYSWANGPIQTSSGFTSNGRVVLTEMSGILCVQVLVRSKSGTNNCTNVSDTYEYYTLAYGQSLSDPFGAVGRMGYSDSSLYSTVADDGEVCYDGYNPGGYGYFDKNGFISDGNSSADAAAKYSQKSNVDTAFAAIGTTGNGGANGFDDLTTATIDALDSGTAEQKIAFHETAAPGF